jgi:S1-C subfamily serine protease
MDKRRFLIIAGGGCSLVFLLLIAILALVILLPLPLFRTARATRTAIPQPETMAAQAVQQPIPTVTLVPQSGTPQAPQENATRGDMTALYQQLNPGVVNIRVTVEQFGQTGQGAGSGFILDEEGHIVTNNHVVAQARDVTVVFYDSTEMRATIVGTDADSDLAVIKVDSLPDRVHPLPLGDSDEVQPGEWVVAIGSPFGLGSSMTLGIVSATGRTIPSGATRFSIPLAIQTDAAINPGNSGGPLLDLQGRIIGVNAQIASGGAQANAGVGFAIPSNIVRRVAPALIENGSYQWPWLGVTGGSVGLLIMEANELESQRGAYIDSVEPDGPADNAGLQGSTDTTSVRGITVPVGGDVVIQVGGQSIADFNDLLVETALRHPGDEMDLTVMRQGQRLEMTVTLEPRPPELSR